MLSIPAPTLDTVDRVASETDVKVLARLMAGAIQDANSKTPEPDIWMCAVQEHIGSWALWAKRILELSE